MTTVTVAGGAVGRGLEVSTGLDDVESVVCGVLFAASEDDVAGSVRQPASTSTDNIAATAAPAPLLRSISTIAPVSIECGRLVATHYDAFGHRLVARLRDCAALGNLARSSAIEDNAAWVWDQAG